MLYTIKSLIDDPRFQRLTLIQDALFKFICDPANPLTNLQQPKLNQLVDNTCGDIPTADWINRAPKLRQLLANIVNFLSTYPDQRALLLDAYYNDRDYYHHLNDEDFSFKFFGLAKELKSLLETLMVELYDKLVSENGYPSLIMMDGKHFNRRHMLVAWKNLNSLAVCPTCDGDIPSEINNIPLNDADHFLPKSVYPLLALHPANLVPVCLECNQRVKRDRDPLQYQGKRSFKHTFMPYNEAAVDFIMVKCNRDEVNRLRILIHDFDDTVSSRVNSLNEVLFLEERWNSRINQKVRSYRSTITNWIRRRFSANDLAQEVKDYLEEELNNLELGSDSFLILRRSYIEFVLSNNEEFGDLIT